MVTLTTGSAFQYWKAHQLFCATKQQGLQHTMDALRRRMETSRPNRQTPQGGTISSAKPGVWVTR